MGGRFSDIDFVRAIRHGVRPDGTGLIIMPSGEFNEISGPDLGAIIAYLKTVPPVDNELTSRSLGPLSRLFIVLGAPFIAAETIDHSLAAPAAVEPGVTAEYGKYLAIPCASCHGEDLARGTGEFAGPNITLGGELGGWSEDDFITALRTGATPDGGKLDPEKMPWESFARLTDDELKAIWLYLKLVPPIETD